MKEGRFPTLVLGQLTPVFVTPAAAMKEGRFPTLVPHPRIRNTHHLVAAMKEGRFPTLVRYDSSQAGEVGEPQ